VLLAGRFAVHEAIRHANKGGVFRATDTRTGDRVVVKQARPFAGATLDGTDARTRLRQEAETLRLVESTGLAPRAVAFFEQNDNGFLVQELVPGVKLRDWITSDPAPAAGHGSGATPAETVRLAGLLTELLAAVHGAGLVFRDFTPNNVMVTPDGSLRLIDFEHAARPAAGVIRAFTYGYAPTEQVEAPRFGPAPDVTADLFALGATVLFTATGVDPVLAEDDSTAPAGRTRHQRLAGLVRALGARNPAARLVAPLVLGLTADRPRERWDLPRVREFLRGAEAAAERPDRPAPPGAGTGGGDGAWERLIDDGLEHILRTMRPGARERLWPSGRFGETTDPCNVQHGASGILSVLTRAAAGRADGRLREAVATTARWVADRVLARAEPLPGLYFGGAGPAWALLDAGLLLEDGLLQEQACELAARVPVRWPNPDVCHGAAGAGMTQLRMWRSTGLPLFADRVRACADGLLRAAEPGEHGPLWPVPASFDSDLAGLVHYGFAHGVAGIGAFLLEAGLALGEDAYLAAALEAGATLTGCAQDDGHAALWPDGPDVSRRPRTHWCSGSSGVGTFLVRLWRHTGDPRHRELAEHAAVAVHRSLWRSSTAMCHGLSGDGEFLLDLADVLEEPRYRAWAGEAAHALHLKAVHRNGLLLVPDESGIDVTCDQATGLAGAVGFLLRLRDGGPRPWTPGADRPAPRPPA
jgi:serine/threonine protein kinase